jgi:pectin methylesterase-like acyl-CoA thioesterase
MKNVIKISKAGIAALVFGIALTGCGGGSSDESSAQSSGGQQTLERSAALSWNAPLQRQNNESLKMAELAGYVISYGQDPENLDQTVYVNDAYIMEYTVKNLTQGTWYFSVQAEDDGGLMSPPSDLVSKTIKS